MIFSHDPWVWIAAILTLAIFSFLYKENPFYRFAEHLFVGMSAGYALARTWNNALVPNLLNPLLKGHQYILIIPALLGLMYLFRFIPKLSHLILIPIAVGLGLGSGLGIAPIIQTDIIKQMQSTIADASNVMPGTNIGLVFITLVVFSLVLVAVYYYSDRRGQMDIGRKIGYAVGIIVLAALCGRLIVGVFTTHSTQLLWGIVSFIGVLTTLSYFFFSREHKGALKYSANIGIWFLMIGFGASFGNTVMGRVSLLIGRVQFLLTDWIHVIR